jgi:hypothetical protein
MDTIGTTGITSASEPGAARAEAASGVCPHCGQALGSRGLEQFLAKLGITDEMIANLKSSMKDIDVEEYLDTARDYLKSGTNKATTFAKENPGKVAAGAAVLVLGAGLLISALNRE